MPLIISLKNLEIIIPNETIENLVSQDTEQVLDIYIDDYAHHPTEIKVTLNAVRQKYPNRRLVVVFKPNTYSRTKDFKDDFIKALNKADKVFLTEIESNREKQEDYPGINSNLILYKMQNIPDYFSINILQASV